MKSRRKAYFCSSSFSFQDTITGTNNYNYNLRTKAMAAGWDGVTALAAKLTVAAGAVLGSNTPGLQGLIVTNIPAGSLVSIINNGYIVGLGGAGGGSQAAGGNGGDAIYCRYPVDITNNGVIGGGGGGGGGGAVSNATSPNGNYTSPGGGGGNGAGVSNSTTGTPGSDGVRVPSVIVDGTYFAKGGPGGAGGGLGQFGGSGGYGTAVNFASNGTPGAGGAPGKAVDGGEYINWISFGDVRGEVSYGVNSFIPTPAATPAVGAAFEGGYYAGTILGYACAVNSSSAVNIPPGANVTLVVDAMLGAPIFYLNQNVKVRRVSDPSFSTANAVVTGSSGKTVNLRVTQGTVSAGASDLVILSNYRIIVAPKESGESVQQLMPSTAGIPAAAVTLVEGNLATSALATALSAAASYCRNLNIGGKSDWYLPAREELELAWRSLKPLTINNYTGNDRALSALSYATLGSPDRRETQTGSNRAVSPENLNNYYTSSVPNRTSAVIFRQGDTQAYEFGSARYLSSSKFSDTELWAQSFETATPGKQLPVSKTATGYVRAVRRSII